MTSSSKQSERHSKEGVPRQATVPAVGEPLDGRHFLDVVEEQQYAGKPFVPEEQNNALGDAAPQEEKTKPGTGRAQAKAR